MDSTQLRQELTKLAKEYANGKNIQEHGSAIIFKEIKDNIFNVSYDAITKEGDWAKRLDKRHTQVEGANELQSSNSSDALLMSIFCYPNLFGWKGMRDLFELKNEKNPQISFGVNPEVQKNDKVDATEIDMELGGYYIEAKLTEDGFTDKEEKTVKEYENLNKIFCDKLLPKKETKSGTVYLNYQVIRNLLAAFQNEKKHILICDRRRGDLVRGYFEIVRCLKNHEQMGKCRVIFWQEIANSCGKTLKDWLIEKYGF